MIIKQRQIGLMIAIITLIAVFLTACGSAPSKSSEETKKAAEGSAAKTDGKLPSTLRIGFISANNKTVITGPEGWAQKKGYLEEEFKKYGVTEFKYTPFPNGPNLNEALSSGALDVGIYGDAPAINGRSAGLKTRLIGLEQVGMNVWLLTKPDGPKTLADLKGKKIATSEGSYMSRYLTGLLKEQGLDKDVKVVHLLPPEGEAALSRGDIAAYAYPTGFGPLILKKGYVILDEAAKHPNLRGTTATVIREDYLNANPQFTKIWNEIHRKAIKDIRANSEEYFKFYSEASEYPLDVVKASFTIDSWPEEEFPKEGLDLIEGTKKFLVEQKLAKKDFELNDWIAK